MPSIIVYPLLKTKWQRVLYRLWLARKTNEDVYKSSTQNSRGYLPLFLLRGTQYGGDAADVRLREIRNIYNVPISEPTRFEDSPINAPGYRLECSLDAIDWDEVLSQNGNWRYTPPPEPQVEPGQVSLLMGG